MYVCMYPLTTVQGDAMRLIIYLFYVRLLLFIHLTDYNSNVAIIVITGTFECVGTEPQSLRSSYGMGHDDYYFSLFALCFAITVILERTLRACV